ncbi:MAG: IS1380 family transposase [Syntrophaceae bacterium]|nr:IS1380 family transposase [Syntrophaceae bacterium]
MVKQRKHNNRKSRTGKAFSKNRARARKINASTRFETCSEQLSPFGGLLALIKFFDLVDFREIFHFAYQSPSRQPKLGHYSMMTGILMLLFIGFNRIWHFVYVRLDAMLCGFFKLTRLPAASTYWRYVDSLGINQAKSILKITGVLRERVWQLCGRQYARIRVDIDTTVKTVYGDQQGARKGHNTKHRGKQGLRPILAFIQETREYLTGKLRKGVTVTGQETAAFIADIKKQLPGCVQEVLLRADGEFLSWQSVQAAIEAGFDFIIANRGCSPVFDPNSWYRPWKRKAIEFNSCLYQPGGWDQPCRFVAMRIPIEQKQPSKQPQQCVLFEDDKYTYRIFCTNLAGAAHQVIVAYDKRADVENLVGEAKREGLDMIPSAKFKNNYAFFQIVMLAYNIWRYLKMIAQQSKSDQGGVMKGIVTNTVRIARLKLLFIAAKVVKDGNRDTVKYSLHDVRTPEMFSFLQHLDKQRMQPKPWLAWGLWPQRFAVSV